jgi:hypothetical protein
LAINIAKAVQPLYTSGTTFVSNSWTPQTVSSGTYAIPSDPVYLVEKKRYWYHQTIYDCPLCGHRDIVRKRREGIKPIESKRQEKIDSVCSYHFM